MMIYGPILTQCYSLDQVEASIANGGYNALKVVTGWGSPGGWTNDSIAHVGHLVQHLVVRTVAGDPSYAQGAKALPVAAQIWAELQPCYAVRPNLYIELGNEPNIRQDWDENFAWDYRWYLEKTIEMCQRAFPQAALIAPALILDANHRPQRWLEIMANVMRKCHFIGIHAYEHDAFLASEQRHGTTGQFKMARDLHTQFFGDKQWLLTEYGINDLGTPAAIKGRRYAALVQRVGNVPVLSRQFQGAFHFHFCADGSRDPQYHIAPVGDMAFRQEWEHHSTLVPA